MKLRLMSPKESLSPPCSYQGGKQRVAKDIVDYIISHELIYPSVGGTHIYDLCCGSGSITIEFLNRGVDPRNIVMLDASSWGKFWKSIGDGSFSMKKFNWYCDQVPEDKDKIQQFLVELSKSSALEDEEYKYLLLQAGSFGGKQIWRCDDKWMNTSFRSYWKPTKTSSRRSPVNPMLPSIEVLRERVRNLSIRARGIQVIHGDVSEIFAYHERNVPKFSLVYLDPPYDDATGYGFSFDRSDFLSELFNHTLAPVYVSEKKPLSDECIQLKRNGAKGGISGNKTTPNEEWLSVFR